MKSILFAAAIAAAAYVPAASAGDDSHTYLTLPVGSYHFSRTKDWREWNPGVGIEYAHNKDWSIVAGSYLNSHDKRTNYLGGAWYPIHLNEQVKLGLTVASVTGYKYPIGAYPSLVMQGERVGFVVIAAPSVGKGSSAFMGFQLRLRMN